MSNPHLPPEMLDYIVDYLHDELGTLMRCSLVSKSWIPRTRKYLFAEVRFQGEGYLKWRKTFPDPTNSPAHYTRTLKVGCALGVTEESDWTQSFSHVEWLIFDCAPPTALFLVPFHNFAPSLKSLHVCSLDLQYPQTFDFICSLPFLEDLCLVCRDIIIDGDESGAPRDHSTSPALTGAFEVFTFRRVLGRILRPLLDLPGGLHFRKVILTRCGSQDLPYVAELVLMCSDTLEHIHIVGDFDDTPNPIDLSKATKLKSATFHCGLPTCGQIVTTLETITFNHRDLQQIAIRLPRTPDVERTGMWWPDLDYQLVKFSESRSISVRLELEVTDLRSEDGRREAKGWAEYLLPGMSKRGVIDFV